MSTGAFETSYFCEPKVGVRSKRLDEHSIKIEKRFVNPLSLFWIQRIWPVQFSVVCWRLLNLWPWNRKNLGHDSFSLEELWEWTSSLLNFWRNEQIAEILYRGTDPLTQRSWDHSPGIFRSDGPLNDSGSNPRLNLYNNTWGSATRTILYTKNFCTSHYYSSGKSTWETVMHLGSGTYPLNSRKETNEK